jgi:general L-amino acid transport system ATP-binding protein
MGLAESGMSMLHAVGFDKTMADQVFFIDADQIIEDNEPEEFFKNPQNEHTQPFLSQILQH